MTAETQKVSEPIPNDIKRDATRTIYIAGAGIAGLTMALSLARFGIRVVVLEQTQTIQTEGAGLQISPNARKVLDALGLSDALNSLGFSTNAIDIYPFRRKTPLVSLQMGNKMTEVFGAPYMVIHRSDLSNILFSACQRHANIEFQFGVRSFDMEAHQRGLSLTVENNDGTTHDTRPYAFIGADGVHSMTRRNILTGPDAIYSGYVAWRALIPSSLMRDHLNLQNTSLLWGPKFHTIAYPHPTRHVVNIAMFTQEKLNPRLKIRKVDAPLLPKVGFSCKRIKAIIHAAEGNWKKWPLYAAKTSQWYKGPVGLIGDAAHAMLPYQAQGAAMAIEDAGVLAPLLAKGDNATQAFAKYQSLRQSRVNRVVKTAASNGTIYHLEWPFTIGRNLFVSAQGPTGHLRRLAWIYDYEVPNLN